MTKTMMLYDGDTFEHGGRQFRVNFEHDDFHGEPWKECDGRGIIREICTREEKAPGERILSPAGRGYWVYDVKATMRLAIADGWDVEPYGQGTKGERAARAVERDFQFFRGWLNDEWEYVVVTVTMLDRAGEETEFSSTVGGVESFEDYHCEFARELAAEVLAEHKADKARKAKETRERRYWAARDVATVG